MHARKRIVMVLTVLTMLATLPLAASADVPADGGTADQATDRVADPVTDVVVVPIRDAVKDRISDRIVDRVVDRPIDRPIDRCGDRITDSRVDCDRHRPDRPIDHCRFHRGDDHPRHCVDEKPHDVNLRHLIWRLIQSHEWQKLFQLLERLGLI